MDERRFDQEQELEQLLSEGLSAPPPEAVLREITPWRRAVNRILTGLVLKTITLNFWELNYILPAIGQILILLGLRPLRRENRAFRAWWRMMLVQTGLWAFQLLRQAAPGWQEFYRTAPGRALTVLGFALGLVEFICLWLGLREVRRGAGLNPGAGGALALVAWELVLAWLVLVGVTQIGWMFFILMLIAYICVFRSLYKLSGELDEAGYALQPAPVRIPDWPLAGAVWGGLFLGIAVVSLTCSRLPMDWQPVDQGAHSGVEALKDQLAGMGFPEEVLADLSAEDIQSCAGALRVVSDVHTYPRSYDGNAPRPLKITGVAVELAGERERWRIFHHFQWESGTEFYGTEAMQFWPTYHIAEGWARSGRATGRVLCERDGIALWAPYHSLGEETFTSNSMFMFIGGQTSTDLFASFSFPRDGNLCRGYVSYETAEVRDGYIIDSWVNYVHCKSAFQYPAMTAQEWRMTGAWGLDRDPFFLIQDAIQFFPHTVDEEGVY